MTDRYNALIVVLAENTRDDDAAPLIEAIKQFRGVESVTANVADIDDHIAYHRVRQDLSQKLWDVLHAKKDIEWSREEMVPDGQGVARRKDADHKPLRQGRDSEPGESQQHRPR